LHKKEYLNKWIRLLISALIFGFLFYKFGCQSAFMDSDEYTQMSFQVSGGYPLFLLVFRKIFGEERYFTFVSLFQNALAVFAVWFVAEELGEKVKLPQFMRYLGTIGFAAPFIGTYFMSSNAVVLSCSILTEGITYPLYYILLAFMFRIMFTQQMSAYVIAGMISGMLILTRPQMIIPFIVVLVVSFVNGFKDGKIFSLIIEIVLVISIVIGGTYLYGNLSQKGENSLNSATILTNLVCVSEAEDASLFEPKEAEIFTNIWNKADETGYIVDSGVINPLKRAVLIENAHDRLKTDIIFSSMYEYAINEMGITDYAEQSVVLKTWMRDMSAGLLKEHPISYIYSWLSLSLIGLIRTNAIYNTLFAIVSLVLYVLYIILLKISSNQEEDVIYRVGRVTLVLIVANALGVATMIMCISRYMVYNMALFYFALMCLGYSLIKKVRNHG